MPFTEERAERLKELFELIEQNGDCTAISEKLSAQNFAVR